MEGEESRDAEPQRLLEPISQRPLEVAAIAQDNLVENRLTADQVIESITALVPHDEYFKKIRRPLRGNFELRNGLLYFKNRVYVPDDSRIRATILYQAHDSPLAGHVGRDKTYANVRRSYWWPGLHDAVKEYVATCDMCQRIKALRHKPHGLLQPLEVPKEPWTHISMDHIMHLPSSNGYDSILVIVDRFSKMAKFVPAKSSDDAPQLASQFLHHVFADHGLPRDIVSDRGPTFASKFFTSICRQLNIKSSLSTAYHPQTDGQTERVNAILEEYLRAYLNFAEDNWYDLLPVAQFRYNSTEHSSTGQPPFVLLTGTLPRGEITPSVSAVPAADDRLKYLKQAQDRARVALKQAQDRYKHYADRYRINAPTFNPGDKIRIRRDNILPSTRPSPALDYRFIGPFEVIQAVGPSAYRIKLPKKYRIHNVFHVSRLEPYATSQNVPRLQQPDPPEPELINDELHYKVQEIFDSKFVGRHRTFKYFVQFEGEGIHERQWVKALDLDHTAPQVVAFHLQYPDKPITQVRKTAIARHLRRRPTSSNQHASR